MNALKSSNNDRLESSQDVSNQMRVLAEMKNGVTNIEFELTPYVIQKLVDETDETLRILQNITASDASQIIVLIENAIQELVDKKNGEIYLLLSGNEEITRKIREELLRLGHTDKVHVKTIKPSFTENLINKGLLSNLVLGDNDKYRYEKFPRPEYFKTHTTKNIGFFTELKFRLKPFNSVCFHDSEVTGSYVDSFDTIFNTHSE